VIIEHLTILLDMKIFFIIIFYLAKQDI